MRKLYILLLFASFFYKAKADHITGGEMFYTYAGFSNGMYKYNFTYQLFMTCNTNRQFYDPTVISVFNRATHERVMDISVPLARTQNLSLTDAGPCITNPPAVCYRVGFYEFTLALPGSPDGYIISSQVVFRVEGMKNLVPNYDNIGATYSAEIPATLPLASAPENNSARFTGSDLVIVCADNSFSYSFAAEDGDGDELQYSFCNAFQGGSLPGGGGDRAGNPASPPPYQSVPYGSGYSGSAPLGNNVQLNSATGLITGIAPSTGIYVITVCVNEIRNGVIIATQRKDLQINIASCSIAAATLLPEYMLCRDTKTFTVSNLSKSPIIKTYNWKFLKSNGAIIYTSTDPVATFTFSDTGIYSIKLLINKGEECSDSATSFVRVYPGFIPGFDYSGRCFTKPTEFTDLTKSLYGEINSWNWDFGESISSSDISNEQNPVYTYPAMGTKNVRLIVTDTKGCRDTTLKSIPIFDKPPVSLAFRDTLICVTDALQLRAEGSGIFVWTPDLNIINSNTATPVVSPISTTTYYVEMNDNGCLNNDSVLVRVTDHVDLTAMNDTIICQGDAIQLNIASNGLQYNWTPASQLNNPNIQKPAAIVTATTNFEVTAIIGSCSAQDQVLVTTVPYPEANAGPDTMICYNTRAQLQGATDGSLFTWAPQISLDDFRTLNPIAKPAETTAYILSAYDTKGCPKPGIDTIVVTVLPDMNAYAGNDTSVVVNQPLQLNATGGTIYQWSPGIGLSATDISSPVAVYNTPSEGIQYKVLVLNEAGCPDIAYITVKVFKTLPSVFVPTAFTPNGDGRNDILRPVAAGMESMEYFRIFNRWGQLVFSTGNSGSGWDGSVGGVPQSSGTYVWVVKATDYTGAPYFQKGTVTLIR